MPENDPLSTIRTHAFRLNKLCDDAASTVQAAETFLNEECSVGIYSSVQVAEDERSGQAECLTYARAASGKFRICVEHSSPGDEEWSSNYKPWVEHARDVKLRTFPFLPALLKKIGAELDAELKKLEDAATEANNLLKNLGSYKRY